MNARVAASRSATSATERRLQKLGLHEQQDYLLHLPLRYEDETRITPIGHLRGGMWAQTEGVVTRCEVQLRPRRQLVARIQDATGELNLRFLHFYPGTQRQLSVSQRVRVAGEARGGLFGLEIVHPKISNADVPLPDALTPVYPTTQGLAQRTLRRLVASALEQAELLVDTVPDAILQRYRLCGFAEAIRTLHMPPSGTAIEPLLNHEHPAWQRIKFDELLAQQLSLAAARAAREQQKAKPLPVSKAADSLFQRLLHSLPFSLTDGQRQALAEISADLGRRYPMQRLLQGDVGSGKTIVAALAAAQAIDNRVQVALMAPTEILAEQLYQKLAEWLQPLGVNIAWLSGSQGARNRREALEALASNQAQLAVGTQALIQEHVHFHCLGLAITDEQHRFGVGQRLALRQKGDVTGAAEGGSVHQLMMSATPIPRSLAMTFYADLDVSTIRELPPGRTPIMTKLVADQRRSEVIERVAEAVRAGRQAYWVCPLVEESEALQLQTAVDTFDFLRAALPGVNVGLVHGRQSASEKAAVMEAFQLGELGLLVATTVIEVGVDVPNASLMVIEHAERFGLAQLHQLRGRVGRGAAQSVCVLLYQMPLSAIAKERLRILHASTDGFEIAQRDLELRGPGELLGVRQSGTALLRFADLNTDSGLVAQAREAATWMRREYPAAVEKHLTRWLRGRSEFLKA